jgi:DNA adenine methylase
MSLLRYCGGKSKQTKYIVPRIVVPPGGVFCEPFVGGGSVTLAIAEREMKIRKRSYNPSRPMQIVINDLDPGVSAFWGIIAGNDWQAFGDLVTRVVAVEPSVNLFKFMRNLDPPNQIERAFKFFYLNRTCFAPSGGKRPLGGWEQGDDGAIADRWNDEAIVEQMYAAREALLGRTTVLNLDFAEVISEATVNWTLYVDPPYYRAGDELYTEFTMADEKHVQLRDMLRDTPADWVLSYDRHTRIAELYTEDFSTASPLQVQYSISKRKATEAIIVPKKKGATR